MKFNLVKYHTSEENFDLFFLKNKNKKTYIRTAKKKRIAIY